MRRLLWLLMLWGAGHTLASINDVPYLSTYYIEPRPGTNDIVTIRYYVTDFEHREYLKDDTSARFTIDYWINGQRMAVSNVPAGDHALTLGRLPQGEVLFALQATDQAGLKSHRLFQEFMVVDPAQEAILPGQVLHPDLALFNVYSNDTNPGLTASGLTALVKWASTNGYRKVVLPKGRYRIHEDVTVQMASGVTLDMNGSTFKLNPNDNGSCLMLEFINCTNAHVVNGIFEGDLAEHDFANAPNNSEWVNCLSISQGSEYSSVENVVISNFPGYGSCTTHRHTFNSPKSIGNNFTEGDVDAQGGLVAATNRVTNTNLIDVSSFVASHGFIQMGIYLGYQGNPAGKWVYRAHFYDAATNYIESIEGYMYRRLYPPSNAKRARFTLYGTLKPDNLQIYNFRSPYNCAYRNIRHVNIRCVGMALSGMDNFLVEGCRFDNCGWAAANCAFDAEDGWDLMHDLTFRNNVFGTNPANEYLTCAGHNFMMVSNVMKAYIWDRTHSFVFTDNTLKSASYLLGRADRTGYVRVTNNLNLGTVKLSMATTNANRKFAVKHDVCTNGVSGPADGNAYFLRCKITGGPVNARVVSSDIQNTVNAGGVYDLEDCTISNAYLKTSGYRVYARVGGSRITDSTFVTMGGTIELANNEMTDTECTSVGDWSDGHEYILASNTVQTAKPYLVYVGNTFRQMTLVGNTVTATHTNFAAVQLWNPTQSNLTNLVVTFRNNRFSGAGGYVLKADRLPHATSRLTVNFISTVASGLALYSPNLMGPTNVIINVIPNLPPAVSLTSPASNAFFFGGHDGAARGGRVGR